MPLVKLTPPMRAAVRQQYFSNSTPGAIWTRKYHRDRAKQKELAIVWNVSHSTIARVIAEST
jgi:hypothetical protein